MPFFSAKIKTAVVVVLLMVLAGQLGWVQPIKDFIAWATGPVLEATRAGTVGISRFFGGIFFIGDLLGENNQLKSELALLQTENALLRANSESYAQLEEALNLKKRTGFNLLAARVVSVDPASVNQTLVVDRGSSQGVVAGQGVIDSAGYYVGRVNRAFDNTSEVTLISDVRSRMPAEVVDSGARGVISGKLGLGARLVEVPQGQALPEGARVMTTGFTPGVPAGLLIGHLGTVVSNPADVFQEANVTVSSDLRRLTIVFIITGSK